MWKWIKKQALRIVRQEFNDYVGSLKDGLEIETTSVKHADGNIYVYIRIIDGKSNIKEIIKTEKRVLKNGELKTI